MNSMCQVWPGNLPKQFVDNIVSVGKQLPVAKTGIGFNGENNQVDEIRKSEIRWINTYDDSNRFITDTVWNFVIDANRNHFGFHLDYMRDVQFTTYHGDREDGGKYDWHQDTFWLNPTQHHRKLSVTIQLSEPEEYSGGDFEIDPEFGILDQKEIKRRGTVIVFPSFLRHRVTPVTSGVRRSLVAWIEGPSFR